MPVRVAYVYRSGGTPFVRRDVAMLGEAFEVEAVDYGGFADAPKVASAVRRADVAGGWFADHHTALAVLSGGLAGTPTFVVTGGYDTARVPEIDYGLFAAGSALQRASARYALEHADLCLPVSASARRELRAVAEPRRTEVVPNAVDVDRFQPGPDDREDLALTVGFLNAESIRRKGVDRLVEVAGAMPDVGFVVAGSLQDDAARGLRDDAPDNVAFPGFVDDTDLVDLYRRAGAYAQLSMHEAFGITVAEAMACGCVPVVSDRYALPEVVGGAGRVVDRDDDAAVEAALREAIAAGDRARRAAAERVRQRFSLDRRRRALVAHLRDLAGQR